MLYNLVSLNNVNKNTEQQATDNIRYTIYDSNSPPYCWPDNETRNADKSTINGSKPIVCLNLKNKMLSNKQIVYFYNSTSLELRV